LVTLETTMASETRWNAYSARPQLPGWIASTLFHAALLLALGLWFERVPQPWGSGPNHGTEINLAIGALEGQTAEIVGESDLLNSEPQPADLSVDFSAEAENSYFAPVLEVSESGELELPPLRVPTPGSGILRLPQVATAGAPQGSTATGGANRGRAAGASFTGSPTTVSVFGVKGTGHRFVYAFDRSSSMEGAPLRAAKHQLIYSLEALDSIHQFQILFFNHRLSLFDITGGQRRIAFADDRTKRLAADYCESVSASGGTDREAALLQALSFQSDVIFFLTDADDPMSHREVRKIVNLSERRGTTINVIEFGAGPNPDSENFLTKIARETGGQYRYINTNHFQGNQPAAQARDE
jgi:hypothetical protein